MKKEWFRATLLTLVCLVVINGAYTGIVWGIAQITPQHGLGARIAGPGGQQYYTNIAQKFTEDRYFWPRPSAVNYNAAGSGGSNKGPSNAEYLQVVSARIDSFLLHNPGVQRVQIPSELVTASGSGLDPDLSPAAAMTQVGRVAKARSMQPEKLRELIARQIQQQMAGLGPQKVNVLELNLALDAIK